MIEQDYKLIAGELTVRSQQVEAVAILLEDGNTVPFIARYRKEVTGSLDDEQVALVRDRLEEVAELNKRRQAIIKLLTERELITGELTVSINSARSLPVLEDIYLPFKQKRRTKAEIAREKGLEPLAKQICEPKFQGSINVEAFINNENEVASVEEALTGARDIIAEWISEDAQVRAQLRDIFAKQAFAESTVVKSKAEEGAKYKDYFGRSESVTKIAGHRLLAMLRGESEKVLRVSFKPQSETVIALLARKFVFGSTFAKQQLELAVADSYKRLLAPSLENELRAELKKKADAEAIKVFADNLRELLLSPPLGQKRVMALDPGFRTGAKLVCLDAQGSLLGNTTIFPTFSGRQQQEAAETVVELCKKHNVEAIAIGNGTASRETESFVQQLVFENRPIITMVNESGASVYSASQVARDEFPDHDVTVRGAVSIGRRLQDPLAELVKIDPKAIGVGQYQHDVNQTDLKRCLEDVVISCVNRVGVELNTASTELLSSVSGLGPILAGNIVKYRTEHGPFNSRKQLMKVARLGARAFQQCAGFLRIRNGKNPLDNTGVHPEQYQVVEKMADDCGLSVVQFMSTKGARSTIKVQNYVSDDTGLATLKDIIDEIDKPGRDPRAGFSLFSFAEGVESLDDLVEDMILPGIVTNVTNFGAFVDVGVHQDGLVHISQLANRFVRDPAEVVKVRQQVEVRVLEVDKKRKRVSLSMKDIAEN